jgi:hypothetical protein
MEVDGVNCDDTINVGQFEKVILILWVETLDGCTRSITDETTHAKLNGGSGVQITLIFLCCGPANVTLVHSSIKIRVRVDGTLASDRGNSNGRRVNFDHIGTWNNVLRSSTGDGRYVDGSSHSKGRGKEGERVLHRAEGVAVRGLKISESVKLARQHSGGKAGQLDGGRSVKNHWHSSRL